ncbi:MAG: FAD-dependent oxidoreductase [Oscillospiraceae bacterium]|nr:FAD-dependent oxidoreductase [Oscillospiraceae bacterium]
MEHYDILIVGGGAAGISAAKAAKGKKVLLAEREEKLGGILLQCAHRGFGGDLSGMEYAATLADDLDNVEISLNTTVLSVSENKTALLSQKDCGRREISFSRLILATGAMEIAAGALHIAGDRPKGVYTAGMMQKLVNCNGFVPDGPVVILGSGDIGLIMAETVAKMDIPVTLVEKAAALGGMARNRRRLDGLDVGIRLGSTVSEIFGEKELEAVLLSNGEKLLCKTLLVAVGLECDRKLIKKLENPEWLRLCGNCERVHPMIESVINDGTQAGEWVCGI